MPQEAQLCHWILLIDHVQTSRSRKLKADFKCLARKSNWREWSETSKSGQTTSICWTKKTLAAQIQKFRKRSWPISAKWSRETNTCCISIWVRPSSLNTCFGTSEGLYQEQDQWSLCICLATKALLRPWSINCKRAFVASLSNRKTKLASSLALTKAAFTTGHRKVDSENTMMRYCKRKWE